MSQDFIQFFRSALNQPLGSISDQRVEAFIELHALMVQVFDGLNEKLFDLTNLILLGSLIELFKLLLQSESEA